MLMLAEASLGHRGDIGFAVRQGQRGHELLAGSLRWNAVHRDAIAQGSAAGDVDLQPAGHHRPVSPIQYGPVKRRFDSQEIGLREAVEVEHPEVMKFLELNEHTARFHLEKEEVTDFWGL